MRLEQHQQQKMSCPGLICAANVFLLPVFRLGSELKLRALSRHTARMLWAQHEIWRRLKAPLPRSAKDVAANGGGFELIELDLANLKSVRACADRLLAKGEAFDVVIANAGVMATPFGHTADGSSPLLK
jgi:NAD(P)-dependent dehydrogenase (short-subunit alcohol dehydrogenase family)